MVAILGHLPLAGDAAQGVPSNGRSVAGLTGFACTLYYRKEIFKSVKNFVMVGVAPLLGGLMLTGIFIKAFSDYNWSSATTGRHEVRLKPLKPSHALSEAADENGARMIVVGSYGEAPLKGVILGSTPYKLLHLVPCPVLVVPATG